MAVNSTEPEEQKLTEDIGILKSINMVNEENFNYPYIAFEFSDWAQAASSGTTDNYLRKRGSKAEVPKNNENYQTYKLIDKIIYMELPKQNLKDDLSSQWREGLDYRNSAASLIGALGRDLVENVIPNLYKEAENVVKNFDFAGANALKNFLSEQGMVVDATDIANKLGVAKMLAKVPFGIINTIIENSKESRTAALELLQTRVLGSKFNSPQAMTYEKPDFRTFEFRWEFVPRNIEESNKIKKIINYFKCKSLPSYNNFRIEFPEVVRFVVYNNVGKQLMASDYCGIDKIYVDYDGESGETPSFHKDGTPVKIMFEIHLRELFIIDRNNVDSFGWEE